MRRNWSLVCIVAAFVILAALYGWMVPPFEGPDEPEHFAYITWLAERKGFPPRGEDAWDTPVRQEAGQSPLYYLLASIPARLVGTDNPSAVFRPNPHFPGDFPRLRPDNDNRAIHYPDDREPFAGGWVAFYLARGLTLFFGIMLLVCTYGLAREMFPEKRTIATAAALLVAANPQVLFISSVVSNDIPAAALSALTLWLLAMIVTTRGASLRLALACGVSFGLAILMKTSAIVLLLPIGAALLWLWIGQKQRLSQLIRVGLLFSAAALLVAGWWFARSWVLYSSPLGLETHDLAPWVVGDPAQLKSFYSRWLEVFRSFWLALGSGTIRPDGWVYTALILFTLLGLGGLLLLVRRQWSEPSPRSRETLLMLALLSIFTVGSMIALEIWMRRVVAPHGRLIFIVFPAVGVLLAAGWYALQTKLPYLTAGLILVLALVTPWLLVNPAYAAPEPLSAEELQALSPSSGIRFGLSHDELFGELLIARAEARDADAGSAIQVEVCWQPLARTGAPYSILVHLIGPENTLVGGRRTYPGLGRYPTTIWEPGKPFCDLVVVRVAEEIPRTLVYRLEIAMLNLKDGERVPAFGMQGERLDVVFTDQIRLNSSQPVQYYTAADNSVADPIVLTSGNVDSPWSLRTTNAYTLSWGVTRQVEQDFQVFAHLRDPDTGQTIAQDDGPPFGGWYPTSWWPAGQIVEEERSFHVDQPLQPGNYVLYVGLYNLATGERLGREYEVATIEVGS